MITHSQATRAVRKWQKLLQLSHWDIEVMVGTMADCSACCQAEPEYRRATIQFDPAKIEPAALDATARHEVAHAVLWPLAAVAHTLAAGNPVHLEMVRVAEESVTTHWEAILGHVKV